MCVLIRGGEGMIRVRAEVHESRGESHVDVQERNFEGAIAHVVWLIREWLHEREEIIYVD